MAYDPDKPFEEALQELLDDYSDADPAEVISALELALYAKKEEVGAAEDED